MYNFGYARVSAQDQNLDTQNAELTLAGCDQIFQEKISGASTSRPMLTAMLATLRPGDTVTVCRLNRLGRSTSHLLELVAEFKRRGVRFVSLDLGIDTGTPQGQLILTIFAALAEFDREVIRERSSAGIAAAKERGAHMGRPAGLDHHKRQRIATAIAAGLSVTATVKLTGIPESTVKRYKRQIQMDGRPNNRVVGP